MGGPGAGSCPVVLRSGVIVGYHEGRAVSGQSRDSTLSASLSAAVPGGAGRASGGGDSARQPAPLPDSPVQPFLTLINHINLLCQ